MLTIVFDLDGTLIDTAPDLIDTLNVTLEREGLPAVPSVTPGPMIGGGTRGMIERALAAERRSAAKADVDRMFELSSITIPRISPIGRGPIRCSKRHSIIWLRRVTALPCARTRSNGWR